MSSLRCPVCKADNPLTPIPSPPGGEGIGVRGTNCRRCKADLSVLFALEEHRAALLVEARSHAAIGRWSDFLDTVEQAHALRAGKETYRLKAVGRLLLGDKTAALQNALLAQERSA